MNSLQNLFLSYLLWFNLFSDEVSQNAAQFQKFIPVPAIEVVLYQSNLAENVWPFIEIPNCVIPCTLPNDRFTCQLIEKTEKKPFPVIGAAFSLAAASQLVVGASTNQTARDTSQQQFYGLKDDLTEFTHYLIVAIIAGFVAAFYTRRRLK